jgi:hypothetical protein
VIILRLAGGVGNQLFQLAAATLLSKCTKQAFVVIPDALAKYNPPRSFDSLRVVSCARMAILEGDFLKGPSKWFVVEARVGRWLPIFGVNDRSHNFMPSAAIQKWGCIMDGYFQRGWTRATFADALEDMIFIPSAAAAPSRIAEDECALHIRGGEFLLRRIHCVVDADYYVSAVLRAKAVGWERFAVVTDDVKYARTIVDAIQHRVSTVNIRTIDPAVNLLEDLLTLRDASARIIGNSSFAWWATALDARRSMTLSPTKFLRNLPRDFYLDWEIKIEV